MLYISIGGEEALQRLCDGSVLLHHLHADEALPVDQMETLGLGHPSTLNVTSVMSASTGHWALPCAGATKSWLMCLATAP